MPNDSVRTYLVVGKKQETPTITTLLLTLDDGTIPSYIPGQCITVYFYGSSAQNGKAYSISSAPFEKTLAVTIRAVGEFSNRLCSMEYGDVFFASLPWGYFKPKGNETDLFMIAAGIGVTPFRGMILDSAHHTPFRQIYLFHSIRTFQEALFSEEFSILAKRYEGLHIKKYVTREFMLSFKNAYKHIEINDIQSTIRDSTHAEFLICGSVSFVCDQRNCLLGVGIFEEQIHTDIHF